VINPWYFQYNIPVAFSRCETAIPSFYKFRTTLKGNLPLFSKKDSIEYGKNEYLIFPYFNDYNDYILKDVPAFIDEPYINSRINYLARLVFELNTFTTIGAKFEFNTSWEEISNDLLENKYFGQQIDASYFLEKHLKKLIKEIEKENKKEKLIAIYDFVRTTMKWNEECSKYASQDLKRSFKERTGNSADINLMLLSMLKKAEFNVKPILLSTRENGILYPNIPSEGSLNYTICVVLLDDEKIFLDATEKYCPIGVLPERCLNGTAKVINKFYPSDIEIIANKKSNQTAQVQLKIDSSGTISGNIIQSFENNIAIDIRNKLKNGKFEDYIEEVKKNYSDIEIENIEINNLDSIYSNLTIKYDVNILGETTLGGDLLYINPMLGLGTNENPFKLDDRNYPVDFAYPFSEKYLFSITIPDNYTVDEIPETAIVKLPDSKGNFKYSVNKIGNTLYIVSILNINQAVFSNIEYFELKELYSAIVSKQAEMIVLKKI
jgi:hypothetical protein